MKNILNQFLNQKIVEPTETPKLKKSKVKLKNLDEFVEVVEKTMIVEDGRQLLND